MMAATKDREELDVECGQVATHFDQQNQSLRVNVTGVLRGLTAGRPAPTLSYCRGCFLQECVVPTSRREQPV